MSRRIRIAYVVTELEVGGAEKCLYELARRLDPRRFVPVVYGLAGRGPVGQWLQQEGIEVHCLGARGPWDARVLWGLWRQLHRQRFDLVHTFLFHANIIGRLAARAASVPRVVSSVRVAERRHRWHLLCDRWTHWAVDLETCVSEDVRRFTLRRARIPGSKLVVIPNGVDFEKYEHVRPLPLDALDIPPGAMLAVFVGRLDPQKGIDTLLECAAILRSDRRDVDLYWALAGAGPLEPWIRRRASQFRLTDRLRLLGWRDDVPALLKGGSVVVLPSRWEGMANVALEAMAAGTPLVASDVEGMRQLAGHPPVVHLVPAGSPDGFAQAVCTVLDRADRASRMARDAAQRVREHFSLARMVEAYVQLYLRMLT